MTTMQTFTNIQELYEDMLNYCKNFMLGISKGTAVIGETTYSNYEFKDFNFESGNNELQFWQSTGDNGANLTLQNVIRGKRVGNPDKDDMFEYSFWTKGNVEPFSILAFRWTRGTAS